MCDKKGCNGSMMYKGTTNGKARYECSNENCNASYETDAQIHEPPPSGH